MPSKKVSQTLDVAEINTALEEGQLLIRAHWSSHDNPKFYTHISGPILNDDAIPTYRLGEWFDSDFMIWTEYMTVEELRKQHDFFELTTTFFE